MGSFISFITGSISTISDFLSFIISIPVLLYDWFNAFPVFIKEGLYIFFTLVFIFIVIKIVVIVKEAIL